jgi:CRAL/TRIO domain
MKLFEGRKIRARLGRELLSAVEELPSTAATTNHVAEEVEDDDERQDPWSAKNFSEMSEQWGLTEDDERNMRDLQNRLADVDHWKNDPFEVVRFYKELRGNVKATEEKFRRMIFWRVENRIDTFLERYGDPDPLFDYQPAVILKGVDKDGDPIFLERTGAFDAYGFYQHFGAKGMMDFITHKREVDVTRRQDGKGWQREYYEPKYGKRVHQYTVIVDMDGLNRNHMRPGLLPLFHQMAHMVQNYYAGLAKRIIVARAPAIFKLFWSLIKHFFEPHIRDLVTFTTHANYLDVLDQYIDREVLPPELCSTSGVGIVMPGFEHIHLEGGILTPDLIENYSNSQLPMRQPPVKRRLLRSSESETSGTCRTSSSLMDDCSSVDVAIGQTSDRCRVVSGVLGRGSIVEEPARRRCRIELISHLDESASQGSSMLAQ